VSKDSNSKIYELNEYGELSIRHNAKEEGKSQVWQAKFLKIMIALLLMTVVLITFLKQ
jgi:hypothetical protein